MSIERHFLGWDAPLARAVDWLFARYATAHECDLSRVLIVVPARRAGRRLLELLAIRAAGRVLSPPRIVTPSSLPEHLYVGPVPQPEADWDDADNQPAHPHDAEFIVKPSAVATPLMSLLARVHALTNAPESDIEPIIPKPPAQDDFSSWLSIASDLAKLDDDLAGHNLSPFDVPRAQKDLLDEHQTKRWAAIIALQNRFEQTLFAHGQISLHAARRRAIKLNACASARDIVLIAASDLNPLSQSMLHQAARAGAAIYSLIHASEDEARAFDELGGFSVESWSARQVDLGATPLVVVDRPRDQAHQIVRSLGEITRKNPDLSPDDITIGLGDESIAPLVERTLELVDTPARHAAGHQASRSRPVLLLQAWAAFVHSRKLSDLASLIRHPDAQSFLDQEHRKQNPESPAPRWAALLDHYISDHLHGSAAPDFVPSPQAAPLRAAAQALIHLAGDALEPKSPAQWADVIAEAMAKLYEHTTLSTTNPKQSDLVRALRAIGDALRQLASISESLTFAPRLTLKQTVALIVNQISATLPPITLGPAVEMLGWLELALDDAPVLLITGLNEGQVPQSVTADPLLPDSIRAALGMLDNRRRYARDLLALTSMLRSHRNVTLITGRRSADGDPLAPSRLLLACPTALLIKRLSDFYTDSHHAISSAPLIGGTPAPASKFLIPLPIDDGLPLESLNVTAFADYIRCPYRFYLKHVRKLHGIDDKAVELNGRAYGTLVHSVLERFAESDLIASTDADEIARFMIDRLNAESRSALGDVHQPAVMLQLEQLRFRLKTLAKWQAKETHDGWRIVRGMTEKKLEDSITLDGSNLFGSFKIEGRIDRIDYHEASRRYRVIDYKTSDKKEPDTPEKSHRAKINGEKQWINLQLPLYHKLVRAKVSDDCKIDLAFVNLPATAGAEIYSVADWSQSDLDGALAKAGEIAANVNEGRFWPPNDPPAFVDEYVRICLDESPDRRRVIDELRAALPKSKKKRGKR